VSIFFVELRLQEGVLAEAGPLKIYVSKRLVPHNLAFDPSSNPPSFVSQDPTESDRLSVDSIIRLKLLSAVHDGSTFYAIGALNEDYLGILSS
jgi:DNA-directed RNA polymerase II subunit RPB7